MSPIPRRTALAALVSAVCLPAAAAPRAYALDAAASRVGFRFVLNGAEQAGTMPVQAAAIRVDPGDLAASSVDVSVDVTGAHTGLIFATQALLGAEVLDAAQFPTIRFVSDRVTLAADGRLSGGATITGKLTIRGVTRAVELEANLYRARGSEPSDLSVLEVQLASTISRNAFGASGFPKLVQDAVGLDILAVIRAA